MANVSATGGRVNQEGSKGQPAATIALSASAAIGAFLLLLAPVFSLTSPVTADLALAEPQKQSGESALFLVGFLVIVPLVVFLVPKLVARVDATPNRDARDGLVGLTAIGLAGIVAVTRTSALVDSGGGLWVLFALTLLWLVFFGLAWFRAAKGDLPGRAWLDDHSTRLGWIAWAGTIATVGYSELRNEAFCTYMLNNDPSRIVTLLTQKIPTNAASCGADQATKTVVCRLLLK